MTTHRETPHRPGDPPEIGLRAGPARGTYRVEPRGGPRRNPDDRRRLARALGEHLGPQGVLWQEAELLTYDADGLVLEKFWPDLVALPASTDEVRAVLALADAERLPVMARGAGTGLAGGALAEHGGIVLSLARMDRILAIDALDRTAVVEPGVVNLDLSAAARAHGLHYAPDPSSQMSSTLGGNLSTNAGGPHCLKYGQTHRHVLGATLVRADGTVVEIGGASEEVPGSELLGAIVGSEGTLAVVSEMTVRLLPIPASVRTFLAVFDGVEPASRAVSAVIAAGVVPSALEMLDRLTIEAVEPYVRVGLPLDAGAALLIELDGDESPMERRSAQIRALCEEAGAWEFREARDDAERKLLWKGRKTAFGAMGRLATGFYVMDGVVPRTRLPEMLRRVSAIVEGHGLRVANVFHAGDGNLHPNVLFDVDDPDQVRRALVCSEEILRACVDFGGSLSGEHGIGSEKREFMGWLYGEDDLEAMRRLKLAFDPEERMNPDKILPTGRPPWRPPPAHPAPGAWM